MLLELLLLNQEVRNRDGALVVVLLYRLYLHFETLNCMYLYIYFILTSHFRACFLINAGFTTETNGM